MAIYLTNKDLYSEIVYSKARGRLTKKAEQMLELLAKKIIKRMYYSYSEDRLDCYQSGLLDLYSNWYNFDEEKGVNAFAYYTEVFKRGVAKGYNQIYKKDNEVDLFSIDQMNSGEGMHSI